MRKKLDVSQALKDFEGKPLEERKNASDAEDLSMKNVILKDVLIRYIRSANSMGLNDMEQNEAYVIGVLIGQSDKEVSFTTAQYDVLKKMTDKAKVKLQDGSETSIFGLEVTGQVKTMVDSAETIDEANNQKINTTKEK